MCATPSVCRRDAHDSITLLIIVLAQKLRTKNLFHRLNLSIFQQRMKYLAIVFKTTSPLLTQFFYRSLINYLWSYGIKIANIIE